MLQLVLFSTLFLIPKYGIIGAAYTSALTLIIINIIQYYYSKKFYNLNYDLYSFFIVSLMTIASYFLSRYLNDFQLKTYSKYLLSDFFCSYSFPCENNRQKK